MVTAFKSATLRHLWFPLAALALTAGYGTTANAVATFSFDGSLSMTYSTTSSDVVVTSFVFADDPPVIEEIGTGMSTGASSAATPDVTDINIGDVAEVSASGSGTAALPDGFVHIDSGPTIDIYFDNFSAVSETVSITLVWDLHTAASTTELFPLETAFADLFALATLYESSGITDVLDEASSFDGLNGPADNASSMTFDITIAAGDFAALTLDIFGHGEADALQVPAPGTIALLALGLLGAGGARRCRAV